MSYPTPSRATGYLAPATSALAGGGMDGIRPAF
jgi:hypothetical protein